MTDKVIVFVKLKSGFSKYKGKIFANSSLGILQDIKPNTVVILTKEQYEKLQRLYGSTHDFIKLNKTRTLKYNRQTKRKRKRKK